MPPAPCQQERPPTTPPANLDTTHNSSSLLPRGQLFTAWNQPDRFNSIRRQKPVGPPARVGVRPYDRVVVIDPVTESPVALRDAKLVNPAIMPKRTAIVFGTFPGINYVAQIVDAGDVRVRLAWDIDSRVFLVLVERGFHIEAGINPFLGQHIGIVNPAAECTHGIGHIQRAVLAPFQQEPMRSL